MIRRRVLAALAALLPMACVLGEVDYEGKRCPCPSSLFCVDGQCRAAPGADAGAAKDAALDVGAPFCPTHDPGDAGICGDFSDPSALLTFTVGLANGTASIDTVEYLSPPGSLICTVRALSSGEQGNAIVNHDIAGPKTRVSLSFAAKLAMTPATEMGRFATLAFDTGYAVGLRPTATSIRIDETVPADAAAPASHAEHAVDWSRGWIHFELALDRSGASPVGSLRMEGDAVESSSPLAAGLTFGGLTSIVLGPGYVGGPSDAVTVHFDDVVLTYE